MIKKLLLVVVGLVGLLIVAVLVNFYALHPKMRAATDVRAPNTPEAIERGRYLAVHVTGCIGCHSATQVNVPGDPVQPGKEGSGRDFGDLPAFPGHIRSPNLTSDKQFGLGAWTDGEILRAMREGVSRDGRPLFPMMPYKTYGASLSDEDSLAIIAYLRTLPPIASSPGKMEVNFPVSMFVRAAPQPVANPAPAAPSEELARGQWLLQMASCSDCHTPMDRGEPVPGKYLAGGNAFPIDKEHTVYATNITPDKSTGIGTYSDDELMRVLSEGVGKRGRPLYMMPWAYYTGMTESDKRALVAALRAVPAVANSVPSASVP